MGTGSYKALSNAEQVFKDLIWTPIIKGGEIALEGAVPILALPVIMQVDQFIIQELTDWMFNNFVMFLDVTAIKIVNAEHQAAFDRASVKLQIVLSESGPNSTQYQEARDAAKQSLSQYIRISGS